MKGDVSEKSDEIRDYRIHEGITVRELVTQMRDAWGFTAEKVSSAVSIIEDMITDRECVKFLSFPGSIVASGTRGIIREMIVRRMVDVIVTTCGTLDHDLARSWKKYLRGSFEMDDVDLHRRGVNRLGNILVPNECYGLIIETKMKEFLSQIWDEGIREISTKELAWEMGKRICGKDSILYWAYRNRIPVYVPGIVDGAVGYQIWEFSQDHNLTLNLLRDESELSNLIFESKRTGAIIIGGGISKHHVIWWNQFKDGLDYAVHVTTAVEWDGSLSGARLREAISWGKVKETAKHVTVEGDATVLLPLIVAAVIS
ncbi:MAG: deoxyhypusine synthase [Nitrososphaerota archaeon]|nr:deoxyhypusine synthase [Candidatus Bathyarchaeota archaeon]MDW8049090.1 deoxyhypusine synthase [Nitrososphaerota archaeon]